MLYISKWFKKLIIEGPKEHLDGLIDKFVKIKQDEILVYTFKVIFTGPSTSEGMIIDLIPAKLQVTKICGVPIKDEFLPAMIPDDNGSGKVYVFPSKIKTEKKNPTKIYWWPDSTIAPSTITLTLSTQKGYNRNIPLPYTGIYSLRGAPNRIN